MHHEVIADRIEAGTYLIVGAATGGDVTVVGLNPPCLELFLAKLRAMGVQVDEGDRTIRVRALTARCAPVDISTLPHPGFATDLQAQFMVAAVAGRRHVHRHRERLREPLRRGRRAQPPGRRHHHERPPRRGRRARGQLTGTVVEAPDLRGGAALVIAGLVAEGATEVRGVHHIDRGYEAFDVRLAALGADVERLEGRRRGRLRRPLKRLLARLRRRPAHMRRVRPCGTIIGATVLVVG